MINTFNQSPQLKQSGFSLLEILITLLVITVGLLGLAHLQTASLQSNHEAHQRSQITLLTNDIIERMRANRGALNGYLTAGAGAIQTSCHKPAGCSNINMAKNDRYEWDKAMNPSTTASSGRITGLTKADDIYSIEVKWARVGDKLGANLASFTTKFQP